ncbi:MAG: hypothetical protein GY870_01470 [archaeon]|nr:hypothetical protein [archaeon]
MEEILEESYSFIQENIFLIARVNTKTGKQQLVMRKYNAVTNELEIEDAIDCIHTAIADISFDEFEDIEEDPQGLEFLYKKSLNIRSSEALEIIDLVPEEKFKALKSWVAGIAEAGKDAFRLESDIELEGNLIYPIAGKLLQFMVRIDSDYIYEYLEKVERECRFEGELHEASLMASLMPILAMLYEDFYNPNSKIEDREKILKGITEFDLSLEIIAQGHQYTIDATKRHPKIMIEFLTRRINQDCIQKKKYKNREKMFFLLEIFCYCFRETRNLEKLEEYDKNFLKTILKLNPSTTWIKKTKLKPYIEKINIH